MGWLNEHLQDIPILDLEHFTITYTSKQDGNQYCIVFHLLTFEIDFFPPNGKNFMFLDMW